MRSTIGKRDFELAAHPREPLAAARRLAPQDRVGGLVGRRGRGTTARGDGSRAARRRASRRAARTPRSRSAARGPSASRSGAKRARSGGTFASQMSAWRRTSSSARGDAAETASGTGCGGGVIAAALERREAAGAAHRLAGEQRAHQAEHLVEPRDPLAGVGLRADRARRSRDPRRRRTARRPARGRASARSRGCARAGRGFQKCARWIAPIRARSVASSAAAASAVAS